MKTGHDGDCTIYASLLNREPTDGICTCGYGLEQKRNINFDHIYSKKKLAELIIKVKRDRNKKTH